MIAKKCSIDIQDMEGVINTRNGSFKHRIFEVAAQQKDFVSLDVEKVLKVLKDSTEQVLNEFDISQFFLGTKETLLTQIEKHEMPLFAKNEVERQKKYNLTVQDTEKKFFYEIPGTDFGISCKFDRIDKSSDNKIFLWDYKMGHPKNDIISFVMPNKKILNNNDRSIQLALYMYIYDKLFNFKNLYGANIYINGRDNLGKESYNTEIENLITKSIEYFKIALNNKIDILPLTNTEICNGSISCDYCGFNYACKIID
jgi:hypothetical protein